MYKMTNILFFKTSVKGSSMKVWTIEKIKSMLVLSVRRKMILSWILLCAPFFLAEETEASVT